MIQYLPEISDILGVTSTIIIPQFCPQQDNSICIACRFWHKSKRYSAYDTYHSLVLEPESVTLAGTECHYRGTRTPLAFKNSKLIFWLWNRREYKIDIRINYGNNVLSKSYRKFPNTIVPKKQNQVQKVNTFDLNPKYPYINLQSNFSSFETG